MSLLRRSAFCILHSAFCILRFCIFTDRTPLELFHAFVEELVAVAVVDPLAEAAPSAPLAGELGLRTPSTHAARALQFVVDFVPRPP